MKRISVAPVAARRRAVVAFAAATALGTPVLASAQSSVTLFGILDTAVSRYSTKSDNQGLPSASLPLALPPGVRQRQTALSSASLVGFRGAEDLGGGLAAGFWLESHVTNDDGELGLGNFARRSTVSLSGSFGELRLGRDYTPIFWIDTLYDPFINIGVGGNLVGMVGAMLAANAAFSGGGLLNGGLPGGPDNYVRTSNSIGYFLPPSLGGIYGQFQYALHENPKLDGARYSPSTRGREIGGRLGYANGPIDVSAAYTVSTAADSMLPDGARSLRRIRNLALGASYDFGAVKLHGELSQVRDETRSAGAVDALPAATTDRYNGAMAGLTVPVGAGLVRTTWSRVRFEGDPGLLVPAVSTPRASGSATATKLALGYVHFLSKRTSVYLTAAHIRIRNGHNNPMVMGVLIGGSVSYARAAGLGPRSATGYDIGIRHLF